MYLNEPTWVLVALSEGVVSTVHEWLWGACLYVISIEQTVVKSMVSLEVGHIPMNPQGY